MANELEQLSQAAQSFESPRDDNPGDFQAAMPSVWQSIPKGLSVQLLVQATATPRVRNQNGWNACTSMALAGVVEARRKVSDGTDLALVAGYIHNCLAERDHAFQPVDAQYAAGLCKSQGVLQGYSDAMPVSPSTCQSSSSKTYISDFRLIPKLDDVVDSLQNRGPIFVDLYIPRATFFTHRGSAILDFAANPENGLLHSMILIGLDFRNGRKLAIVQNSAGSAWGVNGQAKITIGSGGLLTERRPLEVNV